MISTNLAMKVACEPNPLCALSANSLIIAFNLNIKRCLNSECKDFIRLIMHNEVVEIKSSRGKYLVGLFP